MPQCRNCHRNIEKFDNDICPYCGTKDPIDPNYKTADVTSYVDPVTGKQLVVKSKKKVVAFILTLLFGPLGLGYFYLGYAKRGVIALLITLIGCGGVGAFVFFLINHLAGIWTWIGIYAAIWVFFIIVAIYILRSASLKDGKGDFVR